jgi:hypothetical protein
MLPDYPKIKALIKELFHERLANAKKHRLGAFSQVRESQLHEGMSLGLTRYDNSTDNVDMKRVEASAEISYEEQEADEFGFQTIARMADLLGERLAAEQVKLMLQRFTAAVREVGNVTDGSKPMVDQLFEMWEKIYIEFSPDGSPILPTLVMGSEQALLKAKEAVEQIDSDPVLRNRKEQIIEQKRQEWRDREAARNLVE